MILRIKEAGGVLVLASGVSANSAMLSAVSG
jgi:hypothetical protein